MRSTDDKELGRGHEDARAAAGAGSGRKTAFTITLFVGIVLAVTGFMLAAPLGSPTGPEVSEPRFVGAPSLFVLGVVLTFLSPVVYELYPGQDQ